ncbi:hypothetical protein AAFF_G00281060 [Aldrovandia affinis]|uniref:Secreted protein n=1 Tax=Aldrovandia affinis TaxID=143900 RepID=A0AAD7R9X4_9TELE|nr:hypothetical protein AAFF_G00281060 [Aldrovandia affinis]
MILCPSLWILQHVVDMARALDPWAPLPLEVSLALALIMERLMIANACREVKQAYIVKTPPAYPYLQFSHVNGATTEHRHR